MSSKDSLLTDTNTSWAGEREQKNELSTVVPMADREGEERRNATHRPSSTRHDRLKIEIWHNFSEFPYNHATWSRHPTVTSHKTELTLFHSREMARTTNNDHLFHRSSSQQRPHTLCDEKGLIVSDKRSTIITVIVANKFWFFVVWYKRSVSSNTNDGGQQERPRKQQLGFQRWG